MGKLALTTCMFNIIILTVYLRYTTGQSVKTSDDINNFDLSSNNNDNNDINVDDSTIGLYSDSVTTAAVQQEPEAPELWFRILDRFQLVMTCAGFLANLMTFITLFAKGDPFSPCIRLLLQHQSIVDSWVCGITIIILVQPFMWTTGIPVLDQIICHVWHSQGLYWGALWLSIWNLVVFGAERYLAVCKPFVHQHMRGVVIRYVFPTLYVISIIFLVPVYLQTHYYDDSCHSEYFSDDKTVKQFMKSYGTIWFVVSYAIPCALYTFFYGSIVLAFRRRKDETNFGTSKTIEKANAQLTNTAIAVTIVFIISLGFDSWYYMLGSLNLADYVFNAPIQKVGVFFATLNSVANPFVYSFSMPIFRGCLKKTFCPCASSGKIKNNSLSVSMSDTKESDMSP